MRRAALLLAMVNVARTEALMIDLAVMMSESPVPAAGEIPRSFPQFPMTSTSPCSRARCWQS